MMWLLCVIAVVRDIRTLDEMGKRIHLQAASIAFVAVILKCVFFGLETARIYVARLQMAEAGARAGHREEAIKFLEQAFELRDPLLVHMQRNPNLDSLHSEPAYWVIVKKMGMQPLQ